MTGLHGVNGNQIIDSIDKFFTYFAGKDIGPLTNAAIAAWRAEGGLIDRLSRAPDETSFAQALQDDRYSAPFTRWMSLYYNNLLPQLHNAYDTDGDDAACDRLMDLVSDIAYWGGFHLHPAPTRGDGPSPETHEILHYCLTVLRCDESDLLLKFDDSYLPSPFATYTVLFNGAQDMTAPHFNKAAQVLETLAQQWGMAHHIRGFNCRDSALTMTATSVIAHAFADRAAHMIADTALVLAGFARHSGFVPVRRHAAQNMRGGHFHEMPIIFSRTRADGGVHVIHAPEY